MAEGLRYRLGDLARVLGATLDREPELVVSGVAPLETAGPAHIGFLSEARYQDRARASRAGAFLAPEDAGGLPAPTLRCRVPRLALADLLGLFHPPVPLAPGVDPSAIVAADALVDPTASVGALSVIESGATIGPAVRIHPLVYVGHGAQVGDGTILYPHVVIREGVRLGKRVIVHAGAVVGADGFGYVFDGVLHRKIPQVGGVVLEDDVEIGANTAVDRGTLGDTVVRRGTKIDNLVQIGHNAEVGEHSLLAGQVGVSGSCRVGRGVVLGGQVGIADHVTVADGVMIGAQSGVPGDVLQEGKYLGSPARPLSLARRIFAAETRLPDLGRRLAALERRVASLEDTRGPGGGEPDAP